MFLRSVFLCAVSVLSAQTGESVADLVAKTREALKDRDTGRAEGERLLSQALSQCRPARPVDNKACAEAAVLKGLFVLPQHGSTESARPELENAVRFYEASGDDAGLALALETLAAIEAAAGHAPEAQSLRYRASVLRIRRIEQLASRDAAAKFIGNAIRIGPGVSPPQPEHKPEPSYTDDARIAKYQGSVLVSIVIDADGSVRDVKLIRSLGFGLDESAYNAVRGWHFKPSMKDGEPVAVTANVELNFRLL